jgi:hypothetical protein
MGQPGRHELLEYSEELEAAYAVATMNLRNEAANPRRLLGEEGTASRSHIRPA